MKVDVNIFSDAACARFQGGIGAGNIGTLDLQVESNLRVTTIDCEKAWVNHGQGTANRNRGLTEVESGSHKVAIPAGGYYDRLQIK
ncbi:hypothetical protein [Paraburkholderia sp. J12]|uniref:hypothetical protein n=1 Tax=Paraburkholderia sp. J12 TaxID=2805432 RepID=UPI002ABD5ABB|nr:hypothetical protein [Paraburkholderia sp. J12]